MLKLKGKLFLDVRPDKLPYEPQDPNIAQWPHNSFFMLATHTFIKVDTIEPRLILRLTNQDQLKELLERDPNAVIQHTRVEDKLVLTASTKELQAFVLKYADEERVFGGVIVLERKKSIGSNVPPSSKQN